ncbi:MAG: nickel-dependent lactate racemase [Deltaproteobacteria bacterium]|nr:MAG: nickel-dependent lactate racemase [Deltaproteobacteria bacterium]
MDMEIPYGDGKLALSIEKDRLLGVFRPNSVDAGEPARILAEALAAPENSPPLRQFSEGAESVLFLVNDATRPTPTAEVLDALEEVYGGPEPEFLVATGIHRAPTEAELEKIFGRHLERFRGRIHAHDARREDECVLLGKSRNGTEMRVNRRVLDADRIVVISSVEPHYFAGYTGGRKSFLPGVAAYSTIEQNHRLALSPDAQAMRLEGNPVHEDMVDAMATITKPVFAINTVLDGQHRLVGASAGHIHQSLEKAAKIADGVFAVDVPRRAEVVVAVVGAPADIDLYQSQKGIDNGKLALADGGVLILVSACRDGIGERAFVDMLASADSPEQVLEKIKSGYKLGWHKAGKMAEVFCRASVWAVTGIEPEELERMFIKAWQPSELQRAVEQALEKTGPSSQAIVLLDASLAVPRPRS